MEHIDGPSLARWMRVNGAFPVEEASALFAQVLSAVDEAHKQGIFHGDLRPGAILLSQDGLTAKVADFGIGRLPYRLTGVALEEADQRWMAPEQSGAPGSATRGSSKPAGNCKSPVVSVGKARTAEPAAAITSLEPSLKPLPE